MRWLIALLPSVSMAQPYVEVGVGAVTGGCLFDGASARYASKRIVQSVDCSRNPLGILAFGYQFDDRWRLQWEHWSGLTHEDRGAEIVSIRYRHTFK